jgi:copper chaperone NosL
VNANYLIALSLLALTGCARPPLSGPPDLRLGRDECAECGMLINEDRCSSGVLTEEDGYRAHLLFDDIGCMLDAERGRLSEVTVLERYVHDHATRAWVPADGATYLFADREALPTPMGSGIVAFGSAEGAASAQQVYQGRLLTFAELVEARRVWMEERYGKPDGR